MKIPIPLRFLPVLLAASAAVPAPAQQKEDARLRVEVFDFFNFRAMENSVTGKSMRERIFSDLKADPETAALFEKLNATCGTNVPESVETASVALLASPQKDRLGIARFELRESDAQALARTAAGAPAVPAGTPAGLFELPQGATFSAFPKALAEMLPEFFRNGAKDVRFRADPARGTVFLAAAEKTDTPQKFTPETRAELDALIGETRKDGLLIFRKFPRRVPPQHVEGDFCPTVPAGTLSFEEKDGHVKISVVFDCLSEREKAFLERFFAHFKENLLASARESGDERAKQESLEAVGNTFEVSSDGLRLKIGFDCPAEKFPEFLKRRGEWYPQDAACR